jgi:hypothetical protein
VAVAFSTIDRKASSPLSAVSVSKIWGAVPAKHGDRFVIAHAACRAMMEEMIAIRLAALVHVWIPSITADISFSTATTTDIFTIDGPRTTCFPSALATRP